MIDWFVSGRSTNLYVREREQPAEAALRLWRSAGGQSAELLLGLAYLALDSGAAVGWLDEALTPVKGLGRYRFFAAQAFHACPDEPPIMAVPKGTKIVFAGSLDKAEPWRVVMDAYRAQRAAGIFLHTGSADTVDRALQAQAQKSGWPFIVADPTRRAEENLLLLFEALIAAEG
jgi:uncharacterized protein (DUF58 family)